MAKTQYFFFTLFFFITITNNFHPSQGAFLPNTTGYTCPSSSSPPSNQTNYPCQTYVFYTASSPNFLDLASIADLFSISRLMISKPSNISSPSSPLSPNQPLLVPISCACNKLPNRTDSISFANLTYSIIDGDTFYLVSTYKYLNLTTYQSVMVVNPTLVPTQLLPGDTVFFPIFCKCPDQALMNKYQVKYLISYVYQISDTLPSIAAMFGSTVESIVEVNGNRTEPFETIFVPVSRIPQLVQPQVASPPPTESNNGGGSGSGGDNDNDSVVIGLAVGLGLCGVLLILVTGLWCCSKKRKGVVKGEDEEKQEKVLLGKIGQMESREMGLKQMEENLMADVSGCLDKYKVFKIDELRKATDGFDESCLIEGSVYKGYIDGEVFAIKKMKWNACEELKILQKVNHGNLVRLEGFCIDPEDATCYLIYEYAENGSVHWWLHQRNNNDKLSWKTRIKIAIDVANGLQYIHEHTRPRVVHKDIKTSNILLDANMRAKIANFGLAKTGCNAITMHIVGTQGYIAPEYLADGVISTKMDVFSFGVVLLELVSGKDAVDEEGRVLWASVNGILEGTEERKRKRLIEFMDEFLVANNNEDSSSWSMDSVVNVMNVAIASVNKDPMKRPSMVDIVYALCKSDDLFFDVSQDNLSTPLVLAR